MHSPLRSLGARARSRRAIPIAIAAMLVVGALIAPTLQAGAGTDDADTVFVNGKVLLYGEQQWAKALAVKDGEIVFVGSSSHARTLVGAETRLIDLHGKTVMPGMIDGHAHGSGFTACSMGFTGGTIEQVLGKLKACLLRDDQLPMLETNLRLTASSLYIQSLLPPGTRLTRDVLDRLSAAPEDDEFGTGTTRPIIVRDSGGHEFSTNSQAIINAGIDENTPDPPDGFIGRDANGVPNGMFADFSANWGPSPPTPPDSTYLARAGNVQEAARKGITSYMRPNGSISDLAIWQAAGRRGQAPGPDQPGDRCGRGPRGRRPRRRAGAHRSARRRQGAVRRVHQPGKPRASSVSTR